MSEATNQDSGWGKLNKGQYYLPVALDVARALFSVGLGEHCACIFWYVAENSWKPVLRKKRSDDFPESVACPINVSQLAKEWGVPRQRVQGAKDWLVSAKMITAKGDGYWVNKNADEWVRPGTAEPLLSPERLAYAVAARNRDHVLPAEKKERQSTNDLDASSERSTVHTNQPSPERSTVTNPHALNGLPCITSNHDMNGLPCQKQEFVTDIERAPGRVERREEQSSATSRGIREDAPRRTPDYPDPDRYPLIIMIGPFEMPESEAKAIWASIWNAWHNERLCNEFFEHQRFHKASSWREAIRITKRRGKTPNAIRYLETIAADVDVNGPQPDPEPVKSDRSRQQKTQAPMKFHRKGDPV